MGKQPLTIYKQWFLEGPNRFTDASAFRIKTMPHYISREKAEKILECKGISYSDLGMSDNLEVSSWELCIRLFMLLSNLPLPFYIESPIEKKYVLVAFDIPFKQVGEILTTEVKNFINSGFRKSLAKITEKLDAISRKQSFNPISARYLAECEKRNIPSIILNRNPAVLQLGYGKNLRKVWSALTSKTSRIGTRLTANKFILNSLLDKIDIPVPQSKIISDEAELRYFLDRFTLPAVIKPADSAVGKGVSLNIKNISQAKKAYNAALKISPKVIIENQIEGYYYRVTFVNNEMIACAKAVPAILKGDGKKKLFELIKIENKKDFRQSTDKHKAFYKIEITPKLKAILSFQGLTTNTVVPKNKKVFLSFSGADGGEWIEDNKSIHPENIKLMRRAMRFSDLDIAGIDIISPDISVPLYLNGGKLLEINAGPDTNIHANVSQGRKIIVENHILKYIFPNNKNGRIPIISITGTNGKTTTSKLIAHILNYPSRWTIGTTTSENKYINGQLVAKGDKSGFLSARSLLMNPDIDVAILETCHILGIDKRGLGYDWSDSSIITNVTNDHVGTFCTRTKKDLFDIKSVVARRTKKNGYLILNADDENAAKMAEFTRARIAYFSLDSNNPHVLANNKKGLPVYYLKDNKLWEEHKAKKTLLAKLGQIPITFSGKAPFNIQNCLGALAAVRLNFSSHINLSEIQQKLATFGKDFKSNPGRFNLIKKNNFHVAIDYAHNPDGYKKVIALAKKIPHKRFVGVIKSAGDRPDEFIEELGHIAGKSFDYIFIKEPSAEKIRGRKEGEVTKLLKKGVLLSGFPKNKIETFHAEEKAVRKALEKSQRGDLILIFAHDIDLVVKQVEKFR